MTEVSFAKTFLTTLDTRPAKLSLDHFEDPKSYPPRNPYVLPKMAKPMAKSRRVAPGQERSLSVILKSLRNPPLDIALKAQSPLLSVHDIKTEVSSRTSIPVEKLRILHKKKPIGDSKILKELVSEDEDKVEFSIMVIGGGASVEKDEPMVDAPVAQGPSGKEVSETEEFWNDLKAFLIQRLRDEGEAGDLYKTFRSAFDSRHV